MAGLETAIELLENIFIKTTTIGGNYWLLQTTVVLVTLVLLTRKISDWKQLAFPVIIGWNTFGLRMPWIFMVGTGTMFVIDTLSMQTFSNAINGVKAFVSERSIEKSPFKGRLKRIKEDYNLREARFQGKRIDVKEELKKLKSKEFDNYAMSEEQMRVRLDDPSFRTGLRGVGSLKFQGAGSGDTLSRFTKSKRDKKIIKKMSKERDTLEKDAINRLIRNRQPMLNLAIRDDIRRQNELNKAIKDVESFKGRRTMTFGMKKDSPIVPKKQYAKASKSGVYYWDEERKKKKNRKRRED